jgi:phosphoribosylformylglycinamidine (FGAM) synthase-like enzyme
MHEAVREAIRSGQVRSAHDLAEGGLLVALAECAIGGAKQIGAMIQLDLPHARIDALLFGESQSRALITTPAENASALVEQLQAGGVPACHLGTVDGTSVDVKVGGATPREFTWDVSVLHQAWDTALDSYLA